MNDQTPPTPFWDTPKRLVESVDQKLQRTFGRHHVFVSRIQTSHARMIGSVFRLSPTDAVLTATKAVY